MATEPRRSPHRRPPRSSRRSRSRRPGSGSETVDAPARPASLLLSSPLRRTGRWRQEVEPSTGRGGREAAPGRGGRRLAVLARTLDREGNDVGGALQAGVLSGGLVLIHAVVGAYQA